jgi:AcrR family transcriptional regulator
MKKSDATREQIVRSALKLFRRRGLDQTTMRDVAAEAGLALGAAYYYFRSKDDILLAWYLQNQQEHEARAVPRLAHAGSLRERLGILLHSKLDATTSDRKLLAAVVRRIADPADPISAFSDESAIVRARSIALFGTVLDGEPFAAELRPLLGPALWMMHLAIMLYFVHDASPRQAHTRRLVDDALDLIMPLILLGASPLGAQLRAQLTQMLTRARLLPSAGRPSAGAGTRRSRGSRTRAPRAATPPRDPSPRR